MNATVLVSGVSQHVEPGIWRKLWLVGLAELLRDPRGVVRTFKPLNKYSQFDLIHSTNKVVERGRKMKYGKDFR
jgi:hypothetical protein